MRLFSPPVRKLLVTVHVAVSVGWLGAVAGVLALAVAGLTSGDPQLVRAAYLAMPVLAWYVVVPLAVAALVSGVLTSLATVWGLFRHYWVVVKLALTVLALVVLLLQLEPIDALAAAAAETTFARDDHRAARLSLVAHAAGGLLVLVANTLLGVYKPRGLTPYGRRKLRGG